MEVASQIGLKAPKRCIQTLVIGILSLKTQNIYIYIFFFKLLWRPHMAATFGQFPANFRFSGALPTALPRLVFQSIIILCSATVIIFWCVIISRLWQSQGWLYKNRCSLFIYLSIRYVTLFLHRLSSVVTPKPCSCQCQCYYFLLNKGFLQC